MPYPPLPRLRPPVTRPPTCPTHSYGSAQGFWDFLQDRRRVSGTIGASRPEQRPLSHLQLAHFTWNPTATAPHPATEHHKQAAEHHKEAAKHHEQAAEHHAKGEPDKAAEQAHHAQGHATHATQHAEEAAKEHATHASTKK